MSRMSTKRIIGNFGIADRPELAVCEGGALPLTVRNLLDTSALWPKVISDHPLEGDRAIPLLLSGHPIQKRSRWSYNRLGQNHIYEMPTSM